MLGAANQMSRRLCAVPCLQPAQNDFEIAISSRFLLTRGSGWVDVFAQMIVAIVDALYSIDNEPTTTAADYTQAKYAATTPKRNQTGTTLPALALP